MPSLPSPWQQLLDPRSGRAYYYNSTTGESRWQLPSNNAASSSAEQSSTTPQRGSQVQGSTTSSSSRDPRLVTRSNNTTQVIRPSSASSDLNYTTIPTDLVERTGQLSLDPQAQRLNHTQGGGQPLPGAQVYPDPTRVDQYSGQGTNLSSQRASQAQSATSFQNEVQAQRPNQYRRVSSSQDASFSQGSYTTPAMASGYVASQIPAIFSNQGVRSGQGATQGQGQQPNQPMNPLQRYNSAQSTGATQGQYSQQDMYAYQDSSNQPRSTNPRPTGYRTQSADPASNVNYAGTRNLTQRVYPNQGNASGPGAYTAAGVPASVTPGRSPQPAHASVSGPSSGGNDDGRSGPATGSTVTRITARNDDKPGTISRLDPEYTVRANPAKFFRLGKVFRTLYSEATMQPPVGQSQITTNYLGGHIFSEICWFVVIREHRGSCAALRILTYQGQGCAKRGVYKSDHARIHTSSEPPQPTEAERRTKPDERPMLGVAFKVRPFIQGEKMDSMSRINLAKVYTIEHNVKVRGFGEVQNFQELYLTHKYIWDNASPSQTNRLNMRGMTSEQQRPYNIPQQQQSRSYQNQDEDENEGDG